MMKNNKSFVFFLAILPLALAGTALALDSTLIAANEQGYGVRHGGRETAQNNAAMQATCREVLVDTDEGYGVTSRESRFVCDENR